LEPWLLIEAAEQPRAWLDMLESALPSGQNAAVLVSILPPFYRALDVPDRAAHTAKLRQRAIQLLLKDKQFGPALGVLRSLPQPQACAGGSLLRGAGRLPRRRKPGPPKPEAKKRLPPKAGTKPPVAPRKRTPRKDFF
jgi:hypothetical protein